MGDTKYTPLIDGMVWSYSRVKSFEDCKYRWFLKYVRPKVLISQVFNDVQPTRADIDTAYIRSELDKDDVGLLYEYLGIERKDMFFANYGTFMHKLIELSLKGSKTQGQLVDMYLQGFKSEVKGRAPNEAVFSNYFKSGLEYLKSITPLPYNTVDVEKRIDLKIGGLPFCGYIDLVGEMDGSFYVIDNKSRLLKQRSGRTKPTKSDIELDSYLRQLYLYSSYIEKQYSVLPKALCINCFRNNLFIEEPFKEQAYAESKDWFLGNVAKIRREMEFKPSVEFFKCAYICEMQDCCEYYKILREGDVYKSRRY